MISDHERAELYRTLAVRLWWLAQEDFRSARRDRLMKFVGRYERMAEILDRSTGLQQQNVVRFNPAAHKERNPPH